AMVRATHKAAPAAGRPVPATNLHVTLAFLGSVPERRLGELGEVARASAASPASRLELAFDHLEYWQAARLLCALPAERPEAMAALARRLHDELAACGFAPDLKPFRPHVTVARKAHRAPRAMEMQPVTWSFVDLVLVDSRTLPEGAAYTVLEKFPLDQ
ncbi:MAG TPA: RNA 2',3'-cyclic phosphodiesterase, partial [Steroidobacteraceae bacterium]